MLTNRKKSRLNNEVNAGSMADIAFLLLIFFLVTTTIVQDQGLLVKLPPWSDEDDQTVILNQDRVLSMKVNYANQILFEGELIEPSAIKTEAKAFILNPNRRDDRPDSPKDALVSLQNDRGTNYETYMMVYNELKAAYRELRDEEANKRYGKVYAELPDANKKAIRDDIPMIISEAEPTDLEH